MSYEEPVSSEGNKAVVPEITSTPEERQNAMLAHMLGVIGFIGPLIFYITKKDSPFVFDASKEALNFHLTLLIGTMVTLGCGVVLLAPIGIVFSILGGMAAQKGEVYRYPWKLELIK